MTLALSEDQMDFLLRVQVPFDRLFNATGLTKAEYHDQMKDADLWVAFGVTPCREEGHTLRVRSGHCVQCKPAVLSFQNRHNAQAYVYIAHSSRRHYVKVGSATTPAERIRNLNSLRYGQIDDWRLIQAFQCQAAGEVEFLAHRKLSLHHAPRRNSDAAWSLAAMELFSCEPKVAIEAVQSVLAGSSTAKVTNPDYRR